MKSQAKTKTLVTNWAINNTIDYKPSYYRAQKKQLFVAKTLTYNNI